MLLSIQQDLLKRVDCKSLWLVRSSYTSNSKSFYALRPSSTTYEDALEDLMSNNMVMLHGSVANLDGMQQLSQIEILLAANGLQLDFFVEDQYDYIGKFMSMQLVSTKVVDCHTRKTLLYMKDGKDCLSAKTDLVRQYAK